MKQHRYERGVSTGAVLGLVAILIVIAAVALFVLPAEPVPERDEGAEMAEDEQSDMQDGVRGPDAVSVMPVEHATAVLTWNDTVIYTDPVGGAEAFAGMPAADLVLVTDTHGDHLDADTLEAVVGQDAELIVPQAVADELPPELSARAVVLNNGETTIQKGFNISAIPMYNLPDQGVEIRHEKGRGNGYVLQDDGTRVYIAGDTADIPEMRTLEDIDVAFVPMNMPYTMTVERAADGVLAFAPDRVYPYHYRGQEGLSDVEEFERLVNEGNPDIDVVLLDWYPNSE